MREINPWTLRFTICLMVAAMAACGGGDSSDPEPDIVEDTVPDDTTEEDTQPIPDADEPDADEPDADEPEVSEEPVPSASASAEVGASGGAVVLDLPEGSGTVTLEIPAGALDSDVTLTVEAYDSASGFEVPEGFDVASPLFVFGPAGTVFAQPVTIRLPFSGTSAGRTVYWSRLGDETSFDARPTVIDGQLASAPVTHFSIGFVGTSTEGVCSETADCATGETCVGGSCTETIGDDPEDIANYLASLRLGVVTELEVPREGETACCFDLNGNNRLDNAAGRLLGIWSDVSGEGAFVDQLDELLRYRIEDALVGVRGLEEDGNGRVDLAFFLGINDIDLDGLPDHTLEQRAAGEGEHRIHASSVGETGANVQFPRTLFTEGTFRTSASDFAFNTPILQTCSFRFHETPLRPSGARCRGEESYDVVARGMRVEGAISIAGDGISTEPLGLRVGGAVRAEDIATAMNAMYSDGCRCAGIGEDDDMIVVTRGASRVSFACAEPFRNPDLSTCVSGQRMCANIPNVCSAMPLVGPLADIDTNGDGVIDGFSFGLRATLSPTRLGGDRGPIQPPVERCNSGEDEDGDGRTDCEDPACWDDTNCGALGHTEWCRDGRDNNGNGLVDCDDPACSTNLACINTED